MANGDKHVFMSLFTICIVSYVISLLMSFAHFLIGLFVFFKSIDS